MQFQNVLHRLWGSCIFRARCQRNMFACSSFKFFGAALNPKGIHSLACNVRMMAMVLQCYSVVIPKGFLSVYPFFPPFLTGFYCLPILFPCSPHRVSLFFLPCFPMGLLWMTAFRFSRMFYGFSRYARGLPEDMPVFLPRSPP